MSVVKCQFIRQAVSNVCQVTNYYQNKIQKTSLNVMDVTQVFTNLIGLDRNSKFSSLIREVLPFIV